MKTRIHDVLFMSCLVLALVATAARAQCIYSTFEGPEESHANWGTSVAMSGNGQVALVSGPGAEGSDGVVRAFDWDGSAWVEKDPLFPEAMYAYGAWFGWSVALSYDGNTAAIGAPGDQNAEFHANQGAVYVFARNPGTGDWVQQARLVEPTPAWQHSFGQAVALSDSGDLLVVGQRNHIGSEWANIPDSAWVFSRAAGVWSVPVELVGTNLVATDEFGSAVAISPDGQRAVVSAVPGEFNADPRVFVFRKDGGAWPLEQVLDSPNTNGWDSFGGAVAISSNVIMVGDVFYDDPDSVLERVGAVHVFNYDGAEWVGEPEVLRNDAGYSWYQFGHALALRGDYLLVGEPGGYGTMPDEGAVQIVKRMNGQWTLTGTIHSSDPQENSGFGSSVAIAADRADYLIGDPSATVEGVEAEGRAHFVNAISAPYSFDVEPTGSTLTVTVRFLGIPVVFEISPGGDLLGYVMNDCDDAGSFLLTEMAIKNADDPIRFNIPSIMPSPWGGSAVVISNILITVKEVGSAAGLDDDGLGTLVGYRYAVSGVVSTNGSNPQGWLLTSGPLTITAQLTGGYGEPFDLQLTDVFTGELPIDVGFGEYNPTLSVQGAIAATNAPQQLRISAYGAHADGFHLQVTGTADLGVVVEACSDLSVFDWAPVGSGALTNGLLEVVDPDWTNHSVRYYRVRLP